MAKGRYSGYWSGLGLLASSALLFCGGELAAQQNFTSLLLPPREVSVFTTDSQTGDEEDPPLETQYSPEPIPAPKGAPEEKQPEGSKAKPAPSFWEKNPPYRIIPRLGNLPVLPTRGAGLSIQTGTGYYSLLDRLRGIERNASPKFPYPRFGVKPFGYFDANFNYLDSPTNTEYDWSDIIHRIHLGDNWLINTGGEARWMYQGFSNYNLSGKADRKNLYRTQVYGDVWYRDRVRVYVEFLNALSVTHVLPPAPTDVAPADLLNAFIDVKVADVLDKPTYLRVGRQQIYLGSQRLIGQLDWVNTNRTFQGARGFRQGEKFDVDMFWLQPVIPNATQLSDVDQRQTLTGLWTTYRPMKGHFIDVYDLFLSNRNSKIGLATGPWDVNTLGARYLGEKDSQLLWDFEGMMQFGTEAASHDIVAGAATTGVGWHFKETMWIPTLWSYFDYASGDSNPNKHASYNTFNQLYPFGHFYLGWMDNVGRQNILDPNLHLWLFPSDWITIWTQYHHFWLASPRDALYNAAGVPILRDPTGKAGTNVGGEYDFIVNFTLTKHANMLVNYNILNPGHFVRALSPKPYAQNVNVMFVYRW